MDRLMVRPRVYRRLLEDPSMRVRPRVLSKATLTELSHVLENAVIEHDLPGAVFTGFQRSGHWLRELERYQRMVAPRARSITVFAAGNMSSVPEDAIVRVRIAEDSPLVEEWFIIVLTPGFSAVLLGEDTQVEVEDELDRRFETIWSFDPRIVRRVTEFVRDEVAVFDVDGARRIDDALTANPPGSGDDHLRDEVIGDLIAAIEASRDRFRRAAEVERRAADDLRRLDRWKNAFLSAVSHELRTPLAVVHGMAATLDRIDDHLTTERRTQLQSAMARHTERLTSLLDDLLDVDRLSRGGGLVVAPEPLDAVTVTQGVIEHARARERVRLRADDTVPLVADRTQFERIVSNLLDNAHKYAPTGPVEVTVSATHDGGVELIVEDEGPGVPAEERRRVFEAFHRLSEDHPQPGTGVGLSLVQEFVRLHGGRVEVTESSRGGARFVVRLPAAPVVPT